MTKGEKMALEIFPIDASKHTKLVRYHFGKGYDKGYKDAKYDFIKYASEWLIKNLSNYIDTNGGRDNLINNLENYLTCK